MASRLFVGKKYDGMREVFRYNGHPTERTHGHVYRYVIGPFRTKRGAEFMRDYCENNPHCQDVADAERLAKIHAGNPMLSRCGR